MAEAAVAEEEQEEHEEHEEEVAGLAGDEGSASGAGQWEGPDGPCMVIADAEVDAAVDAAAAVLSKSRRDHASGAGLGLPGGEEAGEPHGGASLS
eukprot:COSAG01_NODE_6441_length_3663_cov_2.253367_4_plen_95_part_00